nr:MAG TPA: hypothetical protein [Caudoviricetes sp.]
MIWILKFLIFGFFNFLDLQKITNFMYKHYKS